LTAMTLRTTGTPGIFLRKRLVAVTTGLVMGEL
jgi:hypothetical protein